MQSFVDIPASQSLISSRLDLLNNDKTIMSNNSGTAFPTSNLQIGMSCVRTDQSALYVLKDLTPTWIKIADLSIGLITTASMVPFTATGGVSSTNVQSAIAELDSD
jgi:hypothetical protein